MNQIIFLLMSLVGQQVASESHKIFPARIISQHKTIRENSDLHVTCSTFGSKKTSKVYLYLCKDGNVVGKMEQALRENDTIITVNRVGQNASGNYSCVYSYSEFNTSRVTQQGKNIIPILIIPSFLSADISVSGPSTVTQGEDVEFRCTVSDKVQTLGGCQLIQSYLMKNDSILQVKVFDVARMMANFTVKGALRRDSGLYSCVVLPSLCIQEQDRILSGNNTVLLQVKESYQLDLSICCGILAMCLLLVLCLWLITNRGWISRDNLTSCKSCTADQNTRIDASQQKQTDGQDLEEQYAAVTVTDGDSFSSEDDNRYPVPLDSSEFGLPANECPPIYRDDQRRRSAVHLYSSINHLPTIESSGD